MSEEMYKLQIIDRFKHPRFKGQVERVDADLAELNPLCGDSLRFQLSINGDKITAAAWQGEGCAISLAAADLLAEKIIGLSLPELEQLTAEDVVKLLGIEIKPSRMKCATLGLVCLHKLAS